MTTGTPLDEHERTPYWIAFAAIVLGLVIWYFAAIIVHLIVAGPGSLGSSQTPVENDIDNFLFEGAFVSSALYFSVVSGWRRRHSFGYRRIPWQSGVGAVLLAAFGYYVVSLLYGVVFNIHGTDKLPSGLGIHTTWGAIAVAVYVCAAAPMAEEFFFRGFLFGILRRMRIQVAGRELGPWIAAAVVGLLFGLAHFDSAQPQYLIPLGFLGFVLCIVRWKTRSLYPCMALHSVNNSIALGYNELHWNGAEIVGLLVGSLAVIAAVTLPLSSRSPAPATS